MNETDDITEEQIEIFLSMYRANFSRYLDAGSAREILMELKTVKIENRTGAIYREAMRIFAENNPESTGPSAGQLRVALMKAENKRRGRNFNQQSAEHFREALLNEPNPKKRWDMICQAGDNYIPVRIGPKEWKDVKNHARLYVEPHVDPIQKALQIAHESGIEYIRFQPGRA